MKLIPLTQGQFAQVDDWNYDWLMQWKWFAKKRKRTYYAERTVYLGGGAKNRKNKTLPMHRLIAKTPIDMQADHKDHNGLNNQESNLRNCTRQENIRNQQTFVNKTGYKGVYESPGETYKGKTYRNNIRAIIRVGKKNIGLGSFLTTKDAAIAYNNAAVKYYGKFAHLNIIKE